MRKIHQNPIDAVRIYLTDAGGISFTRSKGAVRRKRADSEPAPIALCPGAGFRVCLFSNRQRYQGFLDAISLLTDENDREAQAWAPDLTGKLYGVAIRNEYDDQAQWVDLRSQRGRK